MRDFTRIDQDFEERKVFMIERDYPLKPSITGGQEIDLLRLPSINFFLGGVWTLITVKRFTVRFMSQNLPPNIRNLT
ncbi:hypothetical protein D3C85_1663610 [compost metagenome]